MLSKAKARQEPIPDGKGWTTIRHLANSRVPIIERNIALMIRVPPRKVAEMLRDAQLMGWFTKTSAGWQGRL